ncbi:MAG: hypothetical protein ACYC54_15560 [Sedimentisphaerales bacterium]
MKKIMAKLIICLVVLLIGTQTSYASEVNNPMTEDLDSGGHIIFNISDLITSGPWVDARNYGVTLDAATISSALGFIGSSEATLLIAGGAWDISNSLTIPSNINLRFEMGSFFNIASGISVKIEGKVDAGLYRIFSGEGEVVFNFANKADVAPYFYPQWWGAVTGDTNDINIMSRNTAAFNEALKWQKTFLADGIYKVNATIGTLYYGKLVGVGSSRSIIKTNDASVTLLNVTGEALVRDIGFEGGSRAVYTSTGNVDSTVIKFESCRFENQADSGFDDDAPLSNSTIFIITDCKFLTSTTGAAIKLGCDAMVLRDCWINLKSSTGIVAKRGTMRIQGLKGVASNSNQDSCWIENRSLHLLIEDSQFLPVGDLGRCIIKNYEAAQTPEAPGVPVPCEILVRNSTIQVSGDHAFKFYEIPNCFILQNNGPYNLNTGYGIYIGDAVSAASKYSFGVAFGVFENGDKLPLFGDPETMQLLTLKDHANLNSSINPLTTDMIFSMGSGESGFGGYQSASSSNITFPYNGIAGRQYDATADGQYFYFNWSLPASLFTNNTLYTAVVDVINNSNTPKKVYLTLGGNKKDFIISNGLHILSTSYFWVTGNATTAQVECYNMMNSDSLQFGRYRIFKGNHALGTVSTDMYGNTSTSVPSSSYIKFYKGDRIIHMDAAAGGYVGRQCTAAGTPGTWKSFGSIAP